MKKLCLLLLLFALLLCSCKQDIQVEESDGDGLQTYQLPTEWTVNRYGKTRTYAVSCEGGTATVTEDGKLLLRVTLDENGNVVARENADGSRLEAVYDADGRLAETLLRDTKGNVQQRTVYDRNGRAVREYTRGQYDRTSVREYTYGEDGARVTELQYRYYESHTYEYHANGELAAETSYRLGSIPYYRREYAVDGSPTWDSSYDEEGNVSIRFAYNEEGIIVAEYDPDGERRTYFQEEKTFDDDGNLTEYKYFDCFFGDSTLRWREEYDYDDNGNRIAQRQYGSEGNLSLEQVMTYDEAGMLLKTEEVSYSGDTGEFQYASEFEWDAYGNNTKATVYDEEGNVTSVSVREYKSIGGAWYMTLDRTCDGEGTLQSRQESTYDEKGNLTSDLFYDGDGNLSSGAENTYDERGNLIERINHYKYFTPDREVMVYDEQNNLLEYTRYNEDGSIDGHALHVNTYEFDGEGRVVRFDTATLKQSLTYACESGSGLRKETVTDENGDVIRTEETVCDNNGNPRIMKSTDSGYELRYDYEWSPEGGLLSCVWSGTNTGENRLETGSFVACSLTEAQYRHAGAAVYGDGGHLQAERVL